MSKQSDFEQLKQAKNLLKKLITDSESIFYGMDKINRKNLNKAKKSFYSKDKFFIKLYNMLDDKNILYTQDNNKTTTNRIPFYTPFLEQKKSIDRSAPYSINAPFQLLHTDVANIRFFCEIGHRPKILSPYC